MMSDSPPASYQLRFRSLFCPGRGFAFPCDAQGRVDPAHLSDHARENYRRAYALVGRELALPTVEVPGRIGPAVLAP